MHDSITNTVSFALARSTDFDVPYLGIEQLVARPITDELVETKRQN